MHFQNGTDLVKSLSVDYHKKTQFWAGFLSLIIRLTTTVVLATLAISSCSLPLTIFYSVLAGSAGSWTAILAHDAMHGSLTGKAFFDRFLLRFLMAPIFIPFATARFLHLSHHKNSGLNFSGDTEVSHWSEAKYNAARPFSKLLYRHRIVLLVFVYGAGLGILARFWKSAVSILGTKSRARVFVLQDVFIIVGVNACIIFMMLHYSILTQYILFWFFAVDRTAGFLLQLSFVTAHYGIWESGGDATTDLILSSRNILASKYQEWFWSGIQHHSAHHLYPRIPSRDLKGVHMNLIIECERRGIFLVQEKGWIKTLRRLARCPVVMTQINGKTVFKKI